MALYGTMVTAYMIGRLLFGGWLRLDHGGVAIAYFMDLIALSRRCSESVQDTPLAREMYVFSISHKYQVP